MNQDKLQKLLDKQQATLVGLAHELAERAIGEAAVRLHVKNADITKHALVAELLAHGGGDAHVLLRLQCEQGARLLGWEPEPSA